MNLRALSCCLMILTASIAAGAVLPSSSGYTIAFVVSAAVAAVAALAAVAIPRASLRPHAHASALDEMGAASPLGDPALASEGQQ